MRGLPLSKFILFTLFACVADCISPAASADMKLLSLIPPGAQAVARISSRSPAVRGDYVLIKRNNRIDFNDFLALSGVDSTLFVHELIFVAAPDLTGALNEHSLLADGSFDRERIYRSAVNGGAGVTRYRGLSVLVVQALPEHAGFDEVRWLAVPRPDLILFGSIASIQRELDRYLSHSVADPALIARLAHLRPGDETWTVLSLLTWTPDIRDALAVIDPTLPERLKDGDTLQFGIHYGRQVEFEYEYEVTTDSTAVTRTTSEPLSRSLDKPEKGTALLPPDSMIIDSNTVRGIIKVSVARYNAWLAYVSARERGRNTASP